MKTCTKCEKKLSLDKFYKHKSYKDGHYSRCKDCYNEYQRSDKTKIKNNIRNIVTGYHHKRSSYFKDYHFKKKYGISTIEYNQMLVSQNFLCKICKVHHTEAHNGLYVDHCHKSEKVRGLLCQKCNSAIGMLREDINIINNVLEYLKQ
jgi:hypothetical protein